MRTLLAKLKVEEDKLDRARRRIERIQKTKAVFERWIQLYKRYLKENGLRELDKIMLENKKQSQMRHLLGLIEHEESINRLSDLTAWIYRLEK